MAELTALRAQLRDRQVKEGALGSVEVPVCLDQGLVAELLELEAEQERLAGATTTVGDSESLAGVQTIPVDTSDIDLQVQQKRAEVRDSVVWLKFRAVSSVRYQEILNAFDDPDDVRADFLNMLCGSCLAEAWSGDDQVAGPGIDDGLRWEEVFPRITQGEWDSVTTQVYALNRRALDAPFSRKPSTATLR